MASRYRLDIVDIETGRAVVSVPPGKAEERDLVDLIVSGVRARGVGWFQGEAKVVAAVRAVLEDVLRRAKREVRP